METSITEPSRPPGWSRHDPLVVLLRITWGPTMVWNVVASHNGSAWYVSGLGHSCAWHEILDRLVPDDPPYTVEVRTLLGGVS